jgi:glycosyltransferase 2 family protein
MTPSPPARSRRWHTLVVGLLTVGLVALFLRGINLREAWQAVLGAHLGWIGAALLATALTYVLRSLRWQVLLAPIGAVSFRTSFRATVMGFAANLLLPARAGEFLRAYVIARQTTVNAPAAFATVIVERLLDLVTVLVLFACGILFAQIDVGPAVEAAGWIAAGGSAVALIVLFVLAGHPERVGRVADRLSSRLPAALAHLVGRLARTLTEGLRVMRSPWHFVVALAWSLPVWMSIAAGIICTTWAFGLEMTFLGSFLVVGYLTVGVTVPTPGSAGGFHYFYQLALVQFFGAAESPAGASAIVLHLVSFVPVTILGLVYMWQDGLTLGQVRAVSAGGSGAGDVPDAAAATGDTSQGQQR